MAGSDSNSVSLAAVVYVRVPVSTLLPFIRHHISFSVAQSLDLLRALDFEAVGLNLSLDDRMTEIC